jgi:hypothetical protein
LIPQVFLGVNFDDLRGFDEIAPLAQKLASRVAKVSHVKFKVFGDLAAALNRRHTDLGIRRVAVTFIRRMVGYVVNVPRNQKAVFILDKQPLVRRRLHQLLNGYHQRLQPGNLHPFSINEQLAVSRDLLCDGYSTLHIPMLLHQVRQQIQVRILQRFNINFPPLLRRGPLEILGAPAFELPDPLDL